MKPETTPAIRELLHRQAVVHSLPLIQESSYGKVNLEPHFYIDDSGTGVDFRIGITKKYVLKDVNTFAKSIDRHDSYSYGKDLQFIHSVEAFDEESRPLVKFICRWVEHNSVLYRANCYLGYIYGKTEKVRRISLAGKELEEFLLLMEGKKFAAEIKSLPEKEWTVTREDFTRKLYMEGSEHGIELKFQKILNMGRIDKFYVFFQHGKIYLKEDESLEEAADFISCMRGIPGGKAFIEKNDVPAFCKSFCRCWKSRSTAERRISTRQSMV